MVLVQLGPPLAPILVNHEDGHNVGDVGGVQDGKSPHGHPGIDSRGLLENGVDLLRGLFDPGLGRAFGQPGQHHAVALVFRGQKPGGLQGKPPAGQGDDGDEHQHHEGSARHHPLDEDDVGVLHHGVAPVEAPVKKVRFLFNVGAQPEGALGGLQGQGVEGADDGGGGDHQGELPEELPGDAGHEGGGQKDRREHQGDADDRAGQLLHGLDGRLARVEAFFDVNRGVLDDDDGVVHHDADGQDQGEQGHQIDREAQQGHGRERADDGHRHGGGRDQHGPPILQKHHDDDEHQDAGFKQGFIDRVNGLADELGGVVINPVFQAFREGLAHLGHGRLDLGADVDGIGPGQGVDQDLAGLLAAQAAEIAVELLVQIDPGNIFHPHQLCGFTLLAAHALDDDIFELLGVGQPP